MIRQIILCGAAILFIGFLIFGRVLTALGVVFGTIVVFGLMEFFGYEH